MRPDLQKLWDQWGQLFIDRTSAMTKDKTFVVRDALKKEWNVSIIKGDRNDVGKAVKAAFCDDRYAPRLRHLEPPSPKTDNNQLYRRL